MTAAWHVLTGEYPPDPGGVSDYTARVVAALAARRAVHVWTAGTAGTTNNVHRVAGRFGPGGLLRLAAAFARTPAPRTLLVQYTPHAFGLKAMNLPLVLWLAWRRAAHGDDLRLMVHEVAFPLVRRPLRHTLLAVVQRLMAVVLLASARRVYVSTPAWVPMLRRLGWRKPVTWLPIPSNLPADPPPPAAAGPAAELVGHFGTFDPSVANLLRPALDRLFAARPLVRAVLVGRGAATFAATLPAGKSVVADGVPADVAASHLKACAVAVQPYPEGATARRTTLMACLAIGVPTVTTTGPMSEPMWATAGPVLVPADPEALAVAVADLLADPGRRAAVGRAGRAFYAARFVPDPTADLLLAGPA